MLDISDNVLNTVVKVKSKMVVQTQDGCKSVHRSSSLDSPASLESIRLHITSLGKDQNSKSEVEFLLDCVSLLHHHEVGKS